MTHTVDIDELGSDAEYRALICSSHGQDNKTLEAVTQVDFVADATTVFFRVTNWGHIYLETGSFSEALSAYNKAR